MIGAILDRNLQVLSGEVGVEDVIGIVVLLRQITLELPADNSEDFVLHLIRQDAGSFPGLIRLLAGIERSPMVDKGYTTVKARIGDSPGPLAAVLLADPVWIPDPAEPPPLLDASELHVGFRALPLGAVEAQLQRHFVVAYVGQTCDSTQEADNAAEDAHQQNSKNTFEAQGPHLHFWSLAVSLFID
jgi:hypothetical protein